MCFTLSRPRHVQAVFPEAATEDAFELARLIKWVAAELILALDTLEHS